MMFVSTPFFMLELLGLILGWEDMKRIEIQTPRLTLREWSQADIPLIYQLLSDPDVAGFNTIGIPTSVQVVQDLLQPTLDDQQQPTRKHYGWSMMRNSDETFLGEIGLNLAAVKFKSAEIYYSVARAHWGKGYASEAAKAVVQFVFETLQLHRLEAGVATFNPGSIRVLEKMGMRREGLRRKILPIDGEWIDNYLYAMLAEDYRALQANGS